MKRLVLQLEGRGGTLSRIGPGESLGIGRAFDNDVVLADPYVSAYEARLEAGPEEWLLRLLDATNPVLVNDVPATGEVVRLADGDRLTFGRTRVRVFDEQRPVEPARPLLLARWLHREHGSVFVPLAVLFGICALDAVLEYLQYSLSLEWTEHAGAALAAMLIVLVWAGIWAGVGQVLRQHHHFKSQLLASSLALLVPVLAAPVLRYVQYPINDAGFDRVSAWALVLVSLAVLLKFNLYFATNLRRSTLAAVLVAGLTGALAWGSAHFMAAGAVDLQPRYPQVVNPPFALPVRGLAVEAYLSRVAEGFEETAAGR